LHIRILDLDGGLLPQRHLHDRYTPSVHDVRSWGPYVRLGCSFGRFRRFEAAVAAALGEDDGPALTFLGSGDFHHVSLALVRRLRGPFNLLVIDNHPDWMRAVPIMHCGTWVYHAARLPQVRRVFHLGGDVDFDNNFRWLAPWKLLRRGKITVFPGVRPFRTGKWARVPHQPLRPELHVPLTAARIEALLAPYREELAACPLYVSLDKDVLVARDAVVNWDSGHLTLPELGRIFDAFLDAARGDLVGMDVVGDWSPVEVKGLLRWALHATEHPALDVTPGEATRGNERTNLHLLRRLGIGRRDILPLPARTFGKAA
jgi:arginase family enzyme